MKKTILGVILLSFLILIYFLNEAKNRYVEDQVFIELNKNIEIETKKQVFTEINDLKCDGYFNITCSLNKVDFILRLKDNQTEKFVYMDKIVSKFNLYDLINSKINLDINIKKINFNKDFLKKRENHPLIDFDKQEISSMMLKYGDTDLSFKINSNSNFEKVKFKLILNNQLLDLMIKSKITFEDNKNKTVLFDDVHIKLDKKEFNKNIFIVLKEREPKYFKSFKEEFIFKIMKQKYMKFIEDTTNLNLYPIKDMFMKDNISLIITNNETIKSLDPLLKLNTNVEHIKSDFDITMKYLKLDYKLEPFKN